MEIVEQESFRDCYQDIKHKLKARSSDDEIGVTIMRWFINNRNLLPHKQLMHDIIRTYSSWLEVDASGQCLTPAQRFDRLYPNLFK